MGARPAVPPDAVRAAAEALRGSNLSKRGRNAWSRSTGEAVGTIALSAVRLEGDVVGVQAGCYAIPLVLLEQLPEYVGDGHNAKGIAWSVDQRDFGAPEFFPFDQGSGNRRKVEELQAVVRGHCLPAVNRVLAIGALKADIRARVLAAEPFEGPDALVRAAAVLLSDGDTELAMTAVRRYAAKEAAHQAEYTSQPSSLPEDLLEELGALQVAFPHFDPTAAARTAVKSVEG